MASEERIGAPHLLPASGDITTVEYLWAISDYFKRRGVTFILTAEAYSFFESSASPDDVRKSYLADSIILLRLVEDGDDVSRKLNVLKMRGSNHETALRELQIDAAGMRVR